MANRSGALPEMRRRAGGLLALAALLWAGSAAAQTVLVPAGATWRYLDTGVPPPAEWATADFPAAAWASGPAELGYGDGNEATVIRFGGNAGNKHITSWFRHTFTVAAPGAFAALRLRLLRDDGAIVYLNGSELLRSNMPAGTVTAATLAATTINGAPEATWHEATLAKTDLVVGSNTLAVEVHQAAADSSDLSFNLELLGVTTASLALVRGPYLQNATPTAMTIRWRTDLPCATRLDYGPAPGMLNQSIVDAALVTEHEVRVSGLAPASTHFYRVGTPTQPLAGGGPTHVFTTLPPPTVVRPIRLWAVGDAGTGDANQLAVRDGFMQWNGPRPVDGILMLGDNAYVAGTDLEFTTNYFVPFQEQLRRWPSWLTLGNHEATNSFSATQSGPHFASFTQPIAGEAGGVPSGTEAWFSFDIAHAHFICLDSASTALTTSSAMVDWLRDDLAQTTQPWIIAFWHHPPYTKGNHDSDNVSDSGGRMTEMRELIVPILDDAGVDLLLYGHSHNYERSLLIDGHYGLSATFSAPLHARDRGDGNPNGDGPYRKPADPKHGHAGAVHIVAGNGGRTLNTTGALNHPAMAVAGNWFGSLALELDATRLNVIEVGVDGQELDRFTIEKRPNSAARHWGMFRDEAERRETVRPAAQSGYAPL